MPEKFYILDNAVVENTWQVIAKDFTGDLPEGNLLLPLSYLEANPELQPADNNGVWLASDTELESIAEKLITFPVIAIVFPTFMDGRGFSLGRLLRSRYEFKGELRAIGNVIRDQLFFLKRCGFNSFELREGTDLDAALASLRDFSVTYQAAFDSDQPLFRRHPL